MMLQVSAKNLADDTLHVVPATCQRCFSGSQTSQFELHNMDCLHHSDVVSGVTLLPLWPNCALISIVTNRLGSQMMALSVPLKLCTKQLMIVRHDKPVYAG